jgi:uncharacterized membrane protein
MNSTKLTGLAIFFLLNLFAVHLFATLLSQKTPIMSWLIAAFVSAFVTYLLQLTALNETHSS